MKTHLSIYAISALLALASEAQDDGGFSPLFEPAPKAAKPTDPPKPAVGREQNGPEAQEAAAVIEKGREQPDIKTVLRRVDAALEEVHGARHPELLRVREALDQIKQAQAEPEERELVGSLGRARRIDIVGNVTFTTKRLRKALSKNLSVVLASHPSEPLDELIPVIAERLRLGYLNAGFPDAEVAATYDCGDGRQRILVAVHEGPRYLKGKIVVQGAENIDVGLLRTALTEDDDSRSDNSLAARIRKSMAGKAEQLPKMEVPEAEKGAPHIDGEQGEAPQPEGEAIDPAQFNLLMENANDSKEEADWEAGSPVKFRPGNRQPLIGEIRHYLARQGRPLAQVTTSYSLQPNGTGELHIRIEEEGPAAVIGKIMVLGAGKNTAEQIRQATRLEPGQEAIPQNFDAATLALWRAGRFSVFQVHMLPSKKNRHEVDVVIRVLELAKVPSLEIGPNPDQEVVLRFIDWVNQGLGGEDLLLEQKGESGETAVYGWSPRDGFLIGVTGPDRKQGLSLSLSPRRLTLALMHLGKRSLISIPIAKVEGYFHLLATSGDKPLSVAFAAGFSTTATANAPQLEVLITPALAFLKQEEIKRDGDTVLLRLDDMGQGVRIDAKTGRLISSKGFVVRTGDGIIRERQKRLEDTSDQAEKTTSIASWLAAASTMLEDTMGLSDKQKNLLKSYGETALWLDTVHKAGGFAPLLELLKKGDESEDDEFFIPVDPKVFINNGIFGQLLSLGVVSIVEEYFPEDTWASDFARELIFILAGQTEHSDRVMESILKDPTIGPYGCLVSAKLLESAAPFMSHRFLREAQKRAAAEAFRHDWQLLIDSQTPLAEAVENVISTLATLEKDAEAKLVELLPEDGGAWMRRFLKHLRGRPSAESLSAWIAPRMDKLWEDHLSADFIRRLEEKLNPPTDPAKVAATVNGIPVPRSLVRTLREQHRAPLLDIPLPSRDETAPWTSDAALACAIRFTLASYPLHASGKYPKPEQLEATLAKAFPDLKNSGDDEWRQRVGLSHAELGQWITSVQVAKQMIGTIDRGVPTAPTDDELRTFYSDNKQLAGQRIYMETYLVKADAPTPLALARAHRLAAAVRESLRNGLSPIAIHGAAKLDAGSAIQIFNQDDVRLIDLQLPVIHALEALQPGDVSEPLALGQGVAVIRLRARNAAPAPEFEQVKQQMQTLWRSDKLDDVRREWFSKHQSGADIRILDAPIDNGDVAPPPSAFEYLLAKQPTSSVALVGTFWERVLAKNPEEATKALDALLAVSPKHPVLAMFLVEPLAKKGEQALALRCMKEAAKFKREAAKKLIDMLVATHSKHGCAAHTILQGIREEVFEE